MSESHLLVTKFTVPFLRTRLLPRTRLIEQFNQSCGLPLVLLSATAGFGKTTLLSTWANQSMRPISWLSLDELDNDPARFWASIVTALQVGSSVTSVDMIRASHQTQPPFLSVLTSLINHLAASPSETVLILDDYHVIQEPAIHSSFAFLLDHSPASLHVVLSSRVDPPLPLSRWRARGRMVEVRNVDLRLSEVETASFLGQVMGLSLGEKEVRQLFERTEGWIAGVQLAGLALQRTADHAAWVRSFSGSHRFILDYVQEEILARQPAPIQQFLLQTAILSEMNASLCQVLTEEAGEEQRSQAVLETLERANFFVVPLDEERRWYRYHRLFREALLTSLRATEPEQIPRLHRRASSWYAGQKRWASAIAHALEAEDTTLACDLIECFIDSQDWHNEHHTLRRWLTRLSSETLRSRPQLSFMYVRVLLFTMPRGSQTFSLVEEPLQWAEQGYRNVSNQVRLGSIVALRAVLTFYQGAFAQAFALARHALTLLPEQGQLWRGDGLSLPGFCLSLLGLEALLCDQITLASQRFQQGLAIYEASGLLPGILSATALLGEVCLARGELQQAAHSFRQALAYLDRQSELVLQLMLETGARDIFYELPALYGLAQLSYEWNDLEKAQHYLDEALAQGQPAWLHILTPGLLLQVRLLCAREEAEQARQLLGEMAARESQPAVLREIRMVRAWLAFKLEDLTCVKQWATSCAQEDEPLSHIRREEEILLLARLWIAERQPKTALDLLKQWKLKKKGEPRLTSELQILLLEALAYEQAGEQALARATLREAITRARPEGYQRLFLDEGIRMEALLKSLVPALRDKALASYVRTLLRAFVKTEVSPHEQPIGQAPLPLDPLTPQEQRALQWLAQGASNQEIADALVIQRSTARKHISSILSKLGAANRTQAIARAREYGLL